MINYSVAAEKRGFSVWHDYGSKAGPVHISDDLVIFEYRFPDHSSYQLNMYPLRKHYLCGLIQDAGFQKVATYGDFQKNYDIKNTDFFIHVAEK